MKDYEKAALDNAKQYKEWDKQCIAKDAFLSGIRYSQANPSTTLVEVEFTKGSHQLIDDIK